MPGLSCPPRLASAVIQAQFQQMFPHEYAMGARKYECACGCPPGMKPSAGGCVCFPASCQACPDDEFEPPLPGWDYSSFHAGWLPEKLQWMSQICCPYPTSPDKQSQPPQTRCPPGQRWEDTERGWVCMPMTKSMGAQTQATILAGGSVQGTSLRQRRALRKTAMRARLR